MDLHCCSSGTVLLTRPGLGDLSMIHVFGTLTQVLVLMSFAVMGERWVRAWIAMVFDLLGTGGRRMISFMWPRRCVP
jgi:hypothetical protein